MDRFLYFFQYYQHNQPNYLCQIFEICIWLFHMKLHQVPTQHVVMNPTFITQYTPLATTLHVTIVVFIILHRPGPGLVKKQ